MRCHFRGDRTKKGELRVLSQGCKRSNWLEASARSYQPHVEQATSLLGLREFGDRSGGLGGCAL